jgi:catechol 2,3-dioxygenase-like lactoylglutathione lyase family enzyme
MKRFHVHLGVPDLAASVRFYSDLFGMPPSVAKPDYAKWMLDDPRVNFAISQRAARTGLNHLGLQADSPEELAGIRTHFAAADHASMVDEKEVACCYAKSNKHWVRDPQGIAWEAFHSLGTVPFFGDDAAEAGAAETAYRADPQTTAAACCVSAEAGAQPAATACCAPANADAQAAATGCCAPAKADAQPATAPRAACCR